MKKIMVVFLIALCAAAVFPQDVTMSISGEVKTGLFSYWSHSDVEGEDPVEMTFIHNSEDDNWMTFDFMDLRMKQGLFRLNFMIERGNIGAKFRFETTGWSYGGTSAADWGYAFLYGSFFNDQFRMSAGKLGDSPWGTGGPDLDINLDTSIGIRFEFMPAFLPGLNIGFVLNDWNTAPAGNAEFKKLMAETVLGLSYTHDLFHLRFAYRLDSDTDQRTPLLHADQGGSLLYYLEERAIRQHLPDFQIFATGYFLDLGNEDANMLRGTNYLYALYETADIAAQLRLGYEAVSMRLLDYNIDNSRQFFSVRPSFYYKFFNSLLNVGLAFEFAKDFGSGKVVSDSFLYWYIEPEIRLNLGGGAYLALVYRYQDDYYRLLLDNMDPGTGRYTEYTTPNTKSHWFNLRAVFAF